MVKTTKNGKFNIHFVGIGGVSMSALAHLMLNLGYSVSGSDLHHNAFCETLAKKGVKVSVGHDTNNVPADTQLLVYTGAVKKENPELVFAQEKGIKTMERSEFLGWVAQNYKNVIAISGTHGKTTTTAMLGNIFLEANKNPTIHLGGESENMEGNVTCGGGEYFITEACEYRNSFQHIIPTVSVVTNIEKDHTDWYNNMGEIVDSFTLFVNNSTQNIVVFENKQFVKHIKNDKRIVSCGFDDEYDVQGYNLHKNPDGCYSFEVKYYGTYIGRFNCDVIGLHNAKNALCAIAVALIFDVDISAIYRGVKGFKGVKRRYEKIGEYKGVPIIADYAHHPTEIKNSIAGALITHKKILCVFQPHTYSRTIGLMKEFRKAFSGVHELVIYKTYKAREKYIRGGSAQDLFRNVNLRIQNKYYCDTQKCLIRTIKSIDKTYDLILVLGAGDIYEIIKKVYAKLKKSVD